MDEDVYIVRAVVAGIAGIVIAIATSIAYVQHESLVHGYTTTTTTTETYGCARSPR